MMCSFIHFTISLVFLALKLCLKLDGFVSVGEITSDKCDM